MTATGLVLITEMFNSAIEALCDFIETNENEKIKVIKDICCGYRYLDPSLGRSVGC